MADSCFCCCGTTLPRDLDRCLGNDHTALSGGAERGSQARYSDETWERPILAQLTNIDLSDGLMAKVVAARDSGERPVTPDRMRLERQMRELGARYLAGDIADEAYLTSLRDLRQCFAEVTTPSPGRLAAVRATSVSVTCSRSASRVPPVNPSLWDTKRPATLPGTTEYPCIWTWKRGADCSLPRSAHREPAHRVGLRIVARSGNRFNRHRNTRRNPSVNYGQRERKPLGKCRTLVSTPKSVTSRRNHESRPGRRICWTERRPRGKRS